MAEANSRQSLSKSEEEFLKKFSLRKFTVPIERLSKQSICSIPQKSKVLSDCLAQKRYRIEYKELKRTLKVNIPWWLKAKCLEDNMNRERLVTLVEESMERVCSSKHFNNLHQAEIGSIPENAIPYISRAPSFTTICNLGDKSVTSISFGNDEQFIDEVFDSTKKSQDEELNEICCVERRLSRVLRILHSLEGIRLDSGCEKCQRNSVTNDALNILTTLCAERSTETLDHMGMSLPSMKKNLCICNLETVDKEIENLCSYIATMMQNQYPNSDPCNYMAILQRIQMIRKSLAEITRKICSEEPSIPPSSPEMLENIQYFIKPDMCEETNKKTKDSKKNKGIKKWKSKLECLEPCFSKNGVFDNLSFSEPCECMKPKKGSFFKCCKKNQTECCCNSPPGTLPKRNSIERVTFSQPLEIKGQSVCLHDRPLDKHSLSIHCKEVQTDFNNEPMHTSVNKHSHENVTCQPMNPNLFAIDDNKKKGNFFACCKNVETNVNGKSMLIPCLIFKQVSKKLSSSLPSASKESSRAAKETDHEDQYTTSYLRCKAEEALNNINFYKNVGTSLGTSNDCRREDPMDSISTHSRTDTYICSAPGSMVTRSKERFNDSITETYNNENSGCCCRRSVAGQSNANLKKPKKIKKSKSNLDQSTLNLSNESITKDMNLESVDEVVLQGDGNITCEFTVAPDVKLCYTTEPTGHSLQDCECQKYLESMTQKGAKLRYLNGCPVDIDCLEKQKTGKSTKTFPIQLRHRIHIEKITPTNDAVKESKSKVIDKRSNSCSCLPLCLQAPPPSKQPSVMLFVEEKCTPQDICEIHESRSSKCANISLGTTQQSCRSNCAPSTNFNRSSSCTTLMSSFNKYCNDDIYSKDDFSPITPILTPICRSKHIDCNCNKTEKCNCTECKTGKGSCSCKKKDHKSDSACRPYSNYCNLCIGKDVPIVKDDLIGQIRKIIGNRRRNSVFLKFTAVGGNLIHLQMCTDKDYLGCLYATESATFAAREANGFDGFITLCVTDTSNTFSEIESLVDHAFMVVQQEKRCSF